MASQTTSMSSTITSLLTSTATTPTATTTRAVYDQDPYLPWQPAFAYSLPIQVLLTGVILALSTVLLIHLVFTAPYHWPLAKINYSLQLSGVFSLLLSLAITISVILSDVHATSREWPYMFNYVAVQLPLSNWTNANIGLWYTLDAVTSGLAHALSSKRKQPDDRSQATHMQFLTFLYPSLVEERLILGLLGGSVRRAVGRTHHFAGPLVLLSSLSSFLSLSDSDRTRSIAESVKNICNSALAILFSVALCIWGFFINYKEAWRTDGGTAIFGAGAVALSLFSMGLNLYQSFLGWWWYVGSAAAEPRSRHRKKKRAKGANKKRTEDDNARLSRVRTKLNRGGADSTSVTGSAVRRRNRAAQVDQNASAGEDEGTVSHQSNSTSEGSTAPKVPWPLNRLPEPVLTLLFKLRQEHRNAAQQQQAENEQRRFNVYGDERARGVPGSGWGLGSFAFRSTEARNRENERDVARGGRIPDHDTAAVEMQTMRNRDGSADGRNMWGDEVVDRVDDNALRSRRPPLRSLETPKSTWSLMGPLRRWRVKDATTYS
ncbi:hypothetical protein PIIN_05712 [Serendipita indica DSM 11827]|uniref:Uncharacterized protein n=1 Tax=Serendipita indica (strain DSM 11827) TaxID=1109443 RepID=G4TKD4_SERID|nr:hypothetical protein PIIN_05712 [Serendipita indica DSM 11827]